MTTALVLFATSFALGYWRGRRARKPKKGVCRHGGGAVGAERCLQCIAEKIRTAAPPASR